MARARFRYNFPTDDYLEVTAEDDHYFRGRGLVEAAFDEPWGERGLVETFLSALKQYPLNKAELKLSTLGYITIRISQADAFGHLTAEFGISDQLDASEALIRFCIDYEGLSALANNLRRMLDGHCSDFTLVGESLRQS